MFTDEFFLVLIPGIIPSWYKYEKSSLVSYAPSASRPLAQLTQFDQIMQIHSQQDPKLRTSSLFHANIQETSQKAKVIPVIYWD